MKEKITLLVTCVGGATVPSLLGFIKQSEVFDYRIVGVDAQEISKRDEFVDAVYQVPRGNAE